MPGFTSWIIKTSTEAAGGTFELKGPPITNLRERWLTSVAADDVNRRAKKAFAVGAKLAGPPLLSWASAALPLSSNRAEPQSVG